MEKSKSSQITTEITLLPEIAAPVASGEQIGTLTIRSGGEALAGIPLVAEDRVDRLSFGNLFRMILGYAAMAG